MIIKHCMVAATVEGKMFVAEAASVLGRTVEANDRLILFIGTGHWWVCEPHGEPIRKMKGY